VVKHLDELTFPALENHIGWSLWRMAEIWKQRFDSEMVALGHSYFGEARSNILRYVGPDGTTQATLVKKMGLTKQAVQQLLDDLVEDHVIARKPNPEDKRGNIIVLTQAGLKAMHDAGKVKKLIEKSYSKLIGPANLAALIKELDTLADKVTQEDADV
jgi:DNA-binding MarR family transcriptional regulator